MGKRWGNPFFSKKERVPPAPLLKKTNQEEIYHTLFDAIPVVEIAQREGRLR